MDLSFYVMSCLCAARWPAVLHSKNFSIGHYAQTVQPKFVHTFHAYRHHWLLPCYTTFTDLEFVWGSQDEHKVKPIGILFWHTFQLLRIKFDMVMKQFKLNILGLPLRKISGNKGNNCSFTNCIKNFNIGMYSEVYKSIWFLLRPVEVKNLIFLLSHPFHVQGGEAY